MPTQPQAMFEKQRAIAVPPNVEVCANNPFFRGLSPRPGIRRRVQRAFVAIGCLLTVGHADAGQDQQPNVQVQAVDVEQSTLYHSPETPGYTAWVGLWQLPDGTIQCDFEEITKPQDKELRYPVVMETSDGAKTWTRVPGDIPTGVCRGMAVLPNGTMVRPVQSTYCREGWGGVPEDAGGFVQRSTDGGRTWSEPIYLLSSKDYCVWPTLIRALRDGRLILFAGCSKRTGWKAMLERMTKTMFISADQGKTWGPPIVMMTPEDGVCEESDFCELPSGDLLWIHRAEIFRDKAGPVPPLAEAYGTGYYDRLKSIARKAGDTFVPERPSRAGFPHSGFPCVLYSREGVILHLATNESHWSIDQGQTWHKLMVGDKNLVTRYYPRALQMADGRILCVSHIGTDKGYGAVDMAIVQQVFRLKVTNMAQ